MTVFGKNDTSTFNAPTINIDLSYTLFLRYLKGGKYLLRGFALHNTATHHRGNMVMTTVDGAQRYFYLSFQVRYNFLDFPNPGGTALSGEAITAGIIYGF